LERTLEKNTFMTKNELETGEGYPNKPEPAFTTPDLIVLVIAIQVQVSSSRQGLELGRPQQFDFMGLTRQVRLSAKTWLTPLPPDAIKAVGNSLMPPRRSHGAGTFVATLLVVQLWLPLGLHASQVDLSVFNNEYGNPSKPTIWR
jgi:hypothetical protein